MAALCSGAAAALAIALYFPARSYQFLNWDDTTYVVNNPWIRALSFENIAHIFTKPYFANFLPLHLLSYMVDYRLWGLNPAGYHLQSILLHALNTALAFFVVRRLIGKAAIAAVAALFFAVHPGHVEAVAWISIRKDLLAALFSLLTVLFYLRAFESRVPRWGFYAGSVLWFTLGLLSKATIVTLPLFLLLVDRLPTDREPVRTWTRDLVTKAPFLILGLGLVLLNALSQSTSHAAYVRNPLTYAMVKGDASWRYLGLLTGILRGSPDYDTPILAATAWRSWLDLAGLFVLPLAAAAAIRFRRRALALGLGWTFLLLLPALAFPLATYMADRYLYLPSLGFCWILAAGIVAAGARVTDPGRRVVVVAAITLVLLVGFGARTVQALPVWRDSESLWSYVITRCGDSRAYTNLAAVRLQEERWDEADRLLQVAVRAPNSATYQNLGVLHFQRGEYEKAGQDLVRALQILREQGWDPAQASVLYYSLGAVEWKRGRPEKTVLALKAALKEDPKNTQARAQLESIRTAWNSTSK